MNLDRNAAPHRPSLRYMSEEETERIPNKRRVSLGLRLNEAELDTLKAMLEAYTSESDPDGYKLARKIQTSIRSAARSLGFRYSP